MSLRTLIFSALSAIPEVQRTSPTAVAVHPVIFPQPARYSPEWPKIRYTFISRVPPVDICGDGEEDSIDTRVQLDIVALTVAEIDTIRVEVRNIMSVFNPPAVLDLEFDEFDSETQTFRWVMDYLITPSTTAGSPIFP